jgi:hypothetical protein
MTGVTVPTLTALFNEKGIVEDENLFIPIPDRAADVPRARPYKRGCTPRHKKATSDFGENLKMEHLTRLSAPWIDSCLHPRIVNQLAGGSEYSVNMYKL